jgi:hypothetical protein
MLTHLWPFDRAVRVSGGLFLFASPVLNLPTYPWNLLGLAVMLTGFVGFCPLYEAAARLRLLFAGSAAPTPARHRAEHARSASH